MMGAKQSFPVVKLDKEKNVIVTGANTGIGYEVAKWIAMMGATVIIACRSEEKAKTAIEKMKKDFLLEKQKIEEKTNLTDELLIEFMVVDMSSLGSVKSFIDEFKSSGRKLHALVCNAGVFNFNTDMNLTEDNHEVMFQVNYLSHFLITLHLLPVMLTSGPDCRIVFVSSEAYGMGNFNKEEMERKSKDFSTFGAFKIYALTKLYQMMHMYRLNRQLNNTDVTVTSVHPGNVKTEIARGLSSTNPFVLGTKLMDFFSLRKTPFQGAEPVINCVVNPNLKGVRDTYYIDCIETPIKTVAKDQLQQDILWDYSIQCLNDYITDDLLAIFKEEETT